MRLLAILAICIFASFATPIRAQSPPKTHRYTYSTPPQDAREICQIRDWLITGRNKNHIWFKSEYGEKLDFTVPPEFLGEYTTLVKGAHLNFNCAERITSLSNKPPPFWYWLVPHRIARIGDF